MNENVKKLIKDLSKRKDQKAKKALFSSVTSNGDNIQYDSAPNSILTSGDMNQIFEMTSKSIIASVLCHKYFLTRTIFRPVWADNIRGIKWEVKTYDSQVAPDVPELGVPRDLTMTSSGGAAGIRSSKIKFSISHRALDDKEGILDYLKKKNQMTRTIVDTIEYSAISACVNARTPYTTEDGWAVLFKGKTLNEFFMADIEMWDPFKKNANAAYIVLTSLDNLMSGCGGTSDACIMPQALGQYVKLVNPKEYEGNARMMSSLENGSIGTLKLAEETTFYYVPPFRGTKNGITVPINPTVSKMQIGEFYKMLPRIHDLSVDPYGYKSEFRSIKIYDESEDSWITVGLMEALENSFRFNTENSGSQNYGTPRNLNPDLSPYEGKRPLNDPEKDDMWFYTDTTATGEKVKKTCSYHGQMDDKYFETKDKEMWGKAALSKVLAGYQIKEARETFTDGLALIKKIESTGYDDAVWDAIITANPEFSSKPQGVNSLPVFSNLESTPSATGCLIIPEGGVSAVPPGFQSYAGFKELQRHYNLETSDLFKNAASDLKTASKFVELVEILAGGLERIAPGLGTDPRFTSSIWRDPTPATAFFENYVTRYRVPCFIAPTRPTAAQDKNTGYATIIQIGGAFIDDMCQDAVGVYDLSQADPAIPIRVDVPNNVFVKKNWADVKKDEISLKGVDGKALFTTFKTAIQNIRTLMGALTTGMTEDSTNPPTSQIRSVILSLGRLLYLTTELSAIVTFAPTKIDADNRIKALITKMTGIDLKMPVYGLDNSDPEAALRSEYGGLLNFLTTSFPDSADNINRVINRLGSEIIAKLLDILKNLKPGPLTTSTVQSATGYRGYYRAPILASPAFAASIYEYAKKRIPRVLPADPDFPEIPISSIKLDYNTRADKNRALPLMMNNTDLEQYLAQIHPAFIGGETRYGLHSTALMMNPKATATGLSIHNHESTAETLIKMNVIDMIELVRTNKANSIKEPGLHAHDADIRTDYKKSVGDLSIYRNFINVLEFATKNWVYSYDSIEADVTDKLLKTMMHHFDGIPISYDAYRKMILNDLPVPWGAIIVRPHATYKTEGMIKIKSKSGAGVTLLGKVRYEEGDDVIPMMRQHTCEFTHQTVITDPKNCLFLRTAIVTEYLSGMGGGYVDPGSYDPAYGASTGESLIVMMVPYTLKLGPRLSLTGNFDFLTGVIDFAKPYPVTNYGTADFYCSWYGWKNPISLEHHSGNLEDNNTILTPYNKNIICHQGHTFYYEPRKNDYSIVDVGRGHWEAATYIGCAKARRAELAEMKMDLYASNSYTPA